MDFSDLPEELKAKPSKCTTREELLALAESEGIELDDEQLEAVSGGIDWSYKPYDPKSEDVIMD